ncbi:MAG: RES family NAD+ phosphorylase [Dehalococcoidia bacterium]
MTPVRSVSSPRIELYRIGHLPDPLAWPPEEVRGAGRFDDPAAKYRVLYAGQRRTCFLETLAWLRPSLETLAAMKAVRGTDEPMPSWSVPPDWYQKRAVAALRLRPGQRWLDVRATETHEVLRAELASELTAWGLTDLDLGDVLSRNRQVTQRISRWAYAYDYHGIVYASRFNAGASLWAIFEGALFDAVGVAQPILPGDPDLVEAARLFGLEI